MTASGSDAQSKSGGVTGLGTLSLAPILLGQAFGFSAANAPGGGLTLGTNGGQFLPQLFKPGDFSQLAGLAQPYQSFLQPGLANTVGRQASDVISNTLPGVNELQQTGFGDRISNLSSFLFKNDIAPQLEEQFGAQLGLDTGDADLRAALIREGQRSSLEAANQSVQNQILGLQMAQQAPSAVAGQIGGVEQALQQGSRQGTPAGQLLDLLMNLGGVNTQAGSIGSQQGTSSEISRHGGFK